MEVKKVEKRDVHITLDFSLQEIFYIKNLMDNAKIEYDGSQNPEMIAATTFLQNDFYPLLRELVQQINE